MKKLLVLMFVLASCSTMNNVPESRYYDYDNYGYYNWDPFPYGNSYGFGFGYDYYPTYHSRPMYRTPMMPKENHPGVKQPEKRQDKGTYNPEYKRPDNNTTPRYNGNQPNGNRQQPSEGSKPINGRNIR
jgi:hypothetical protein